MKRGAWHQFGDRSQRLALELLQQGAGVGVVLSPRDLSCERAIELSPQYRDAGASVVIDPQFYLPNSTVGRLTTYGGIAPFRQTISQLHQIPDVQLASLQSELHKLSASLQVDAVLAPAVVYEAGRPDIIELNGKLFTAAQNVGQVLGVPTIATVVVGSSAAASDETADAILSAVTALAADGWYFAFESDEQRIPATHSFILRLCRAGLILACSGRPLLHAFAGPLSLLSPCFGATAAAVGHSQNLWQFTRDRWQPTEGGGGGGNAPPRLFSTRLWGTIVYEDEFALLSDDMRAAILTTSPFSVPVSATPPYLPWDRWQANKHLVYLLVMHADKALQEVDAEKACHAAIETLKEAVSLHTRILAEGVTLADKTQTYQNPWRAALSSLVAGSHDEFEMLRMLREIG